MAEERRDSHHDPSATVAQHGKHRNRASKVLLLVIVALFFWRLISAGIPHGDTFPLLSRAYNDIETAELAVNKMLSDAAVPHLRDLFNNPDTLDAATNEETIQRHTVALYLLLKEGKRTTLDLHPDIRARLSDTYMDIGKDAWQENLYVFYIPHGYGDDTNALDRRFIETYISSRKSAVPMQQELPIYIVSRGPDGVLGVLEQNRYGDAVGAGDDRSNLRIHRRKRSEP